MNELYISFEKLYSQGMDEQSILEILKGEFPDIVNENSIKKVNSECEDGESKISMSGLVPRLYVNIGHGKCLSVQDILNIKNHPDSFLDNNGRIINPFTKSVLSSEILKQFDELLDSVSLSEEPYFNIDTKINKLRKKVSSGRLWDLRKTIRSLKRYVRDLQEEPDTIPMTTSGVLLTDYIEDEILPLMENNNEFLSELLNINSLEEYHIVASLLKDGYDVFQGSGRAQRALFLE